MKLDRTSLLYSTLLLTGVSIVAQLVGFVYRIFLSRMIGAEVMGLYQLLMPLYSVFSALIASGLTVGLSTLTAEYHALGNRRAEARLMKTALRAFALLWVVLAAVVIPGSDAISVWVLGDARTQLGLILLMPCLLLTGVENLTKHHFYGAGEVRLPAAVELGEQFIRAFAVLGLLAVFLPQWPERTVGLIVAGMLCSEVFSASALTLARRRRERQGIPSSGPGERPGVLRRRLALTAVPIGATALLGNLMSSANAVLIPQLLEGLPFKVFAASSIDALVHAVESALSPKATPYTKLFGYKAIEMIIRGYQTIAKKGPESRFSLLNDFLLASNYAGLAFGTAGCAAVHATSYPLGGKYHVAHGESNYAMFTGVLKNYLELRQDGEIAVMNEFLARLLGCGTQAVYDRLEDLLNQLLPKRSLHEYGVTRQDLRDFTHSVITGQGRLMDNSFVPLDETRVLKIYTELF